MSVRKLALRTSLGRARGLGSARVGVEHWWLERLLAIALVPLMLWFAFAVAARTGADHGAVVEWIGSPLNTVLMILMIGAAFRHGQIGLCNVIEDYVKIERVRFALVLLVQFAAAALGLASIIAVLKIAVGG
ncbi:MAG: succinate dehydrogenase, hydrophobic membrane anchor protein [Alphaproteobacteria bacterium]